MTKKNQPVKAAPVKVTPEIFVRLDGSYLIIQCGDATKFVQLIWQHPHGDPKQKLTLQECTEVPRQFESLVYRR